VPSTILEPALVDLLARLAFVERNPVLRTSADFEARRHDRGQRVAIATQEISTWLVNLGEAYFKVRRELEGPRGTGRRSDLFSDVDQQIRWLFFDGFLTMTPWEWLRHYPRYLQAIAYRIERGSAPGSRDEQSSRLIVDLWQRWLAKLPEGQRDARTQSSSEFRWTIEELRVSLFAQQLGTSVKVSPQRCEKLLQ
jgi:ATP-dependent helicase HrpA